ncbi:hypothetical protein [Rhizobium sp. 1399]|uniref:hypothetical protein n=1 Tax=Rhizobium sp. 1399 TaxID=2817758 RepID=UPI002869EEBB|nr:hypothetical protein [Rhizobium sp. 1399]
MPTAEALATLPQALADAIDPLARLQSILAEGLREWIAGAPGREDLLRADLGVGGASGQPAPTSLLKRMLDAIAIQVLGARYDAVGRFEVPLVEALEGREDATSALLLAAHIAAMPVGANESLLPAAWRVQPPAVFGATYQPDVTLRIADASPFTLDQLRQQAGFDITSTQKQIKQDIDVLRLMWSHAAEVSAAQPGEIRGLRYFELPREQPGGMGLPLQLVQRFIDPPPAGQGQSADSSDIFAGVSFDRVRASASLAFAAPFIEGLVSGRTDWSRAKPGDTSTPLFERFNKSLSALLLGDAQVQGLYATMAVQAAADAGVAAASPLFELITYLLDRAAEEAIRIGTALGPRIDPFKTETQLPLPLAFQIDQLQTFSRHVDDWTRLSGYGLLVRRAGAANPTPFVSLNAATMFFGLRQQPAQSSDPAFLKELRTLHEAREPVPGVAADGAPRLFVDPHPFAPGDQVGVSDAIAEYANAWQTAPMPGQAALGQDGGAVGVEAARFLFGPPGAQALKLPTLSFGRRYEMRAHLVAQGGVLAPFARHPNNPYVLRSDIPDAPSLTASIDYVRTVAISAPSFSTDAPPPPTAINLLANELPKRVPRRRLGAAGLRMNHNRIKGMPKIACAPGPGGGLRFAFVVDSTGPARIDLFIEAVGQGDYPLAIDLAGAVSGQWYRLDIFRDGNVIVSMRPVGIGAEDELRMSANWTEVARVELPYLPDAVGLRLASAMDVDVEPLAVTLIADIGGNVSELSQSSGGDAPRAAPLLLDGLDRSSPRPAQRLSNGLVRSSAVVEVRGPSLDRHSWERWVNCALFADGASSALRTRVAATLDQLQGEGADNRSDLADPAVSGLWLELWEVFPNRARIASPLAFFADRADPFARARVALAISVGEPDLAGGGSFLRDGADKATVQCVAGRVYEVLARAVVRSQDRPFDGITQNRDRLGSALLESCSQTVLTGETLLLGPISVLPIEVATAELPILKSAQWSSNTVVRRRWEGARRVVDLKFPPALFVGTDGGRRALRYCVSASLAPQRWTWRGRPSPQGESQLFDRAFAGRRNNDHGSLQTGMLRVAHALSLEPGSVEPPPTIVTRDLDWRGGWNLWRFGVLLNSRYSALFQPHVQHLAAKELHRDDTRYRWLDVSLPDAANGRAVSKPPLILILPLTEAGIDDGMVPPLLALIAEPMHANDHFGDGVLVAVDVTRHPFPAFQRDKTATGLPPEQKLKYLPEVGPDPIRSGKAHPGDAIAMRLDGPIGYGFDLGSEAGRVTHSGYLISPIRHKLDPWSMIKLKMRRFERSGHPPPADPETGPLSVRSAQSAQGLPDVGSQDGMPFEGLVIEPQFLLDTAFDIRFYREGSFAEGPVGQRLELIVSQHADGWLVSVFVLKVDPAHAADWTSADRAANAGTYSFRPGPHRPRIRLIVSARARPERDADWAPSGDVLVQANMGDGEVEDGGNGWMTIFALPIEADFRAPVSSEPRVIVNVPVRVEHVRLSDYSPSIWCQFTVASSKVQLEAISAVGATVETVQIEALDFRLPNGTTDKDWTKMILHRADQPRRMLADIAPEPDSGSELSEKRVAIFTEDAFDISHQVRERPVVAVLLGDVQHKTKTVTGVQRILWQDDPGSKPSRSGRWRLLRVLCRANDEITSLEDLFAEPFDARPQVPADALGMILTVSRPFPGTDT